MGTILSQRGHHKTNDGSLFHLPAEHFEITKSRKPFGEQKVGVKAHQEHINCTQAERQFYRDSCRSSERTLETIGTETFLGSGSRDACSLNATIHYSFDYAQ